MAAHLSVALLVIAAEQRLTMYLSGDTILIMLTEIHMVSPDKSQWAGVIKLTEK